MAAQNQIIATFDNTKVVITLTYDDVTFVAASMSVLYGSAANTVVDVAIRDSGTQAIVGTHRFSAAQGGVWTLPGGLIFAPAQGALVGQDLGFSWGRP